MASLSPHPGGKRVERAGRAVQAADMISRSPPDGCLIHSGTGDVSIACWSAFVLPEIANMRFHNFGSIAMHKAAFTELVSNLRLLNPQQLAQLGAELPHSQRRVEAMLALDARCGDDADPRNHENISGAEPLAARHFKRRLGIGKVIERNDDPCI